MVAGRAVDRRGTRIDFMVAIYNRQRRSSPVSSLPVVPRASTGSSSGCGNYFIETNADDSQAPPALLHRRWDMRNRIEDALDSRLRGYVCHP